MKSMESLSSQVAKAGKALASVANSPAPKVDRGSDKLPMCKGK